MKTYEYGRIRTLAMNLEQQGIESDTVEQILEGGESILKGTSPAKKADWMRGAMQRMDILLDKPIRHSVREACACCLGGKRLKTSQEIARKGGSLEERIRAVDESKYIGKVETREDGSLLIRFSPEGQEAYRCVCLPQAKEPISITYCYCCGGHVKHHLQIALGRTVEMRVRSSALSSGGTKPCSFVFQVQDT